MKLSRFGVVGASPGRVSRAGRRVLEELAAAGAELAVWIEGEPEEPLPWGLDRPAALPGKTVRICSREQAAEVLESSPVDFLLQLGGGWEQFPQPRFGVWRLTTAGPGPLAFWDVYDGLFHLEIRLERLLEAPRSVPLERRWIQVNRLSYAKTVDRVVEEMAEMVVHVAGCGPPEPAPQAVVFPPRHTVWPSAAQRTALKAKLAMRVAADQYRGVLYAESWKTGVIEAPVSEFLDMGYVPEIHWLPSPPGQRFLADPFLVLLPEGWLLLAEDFDFATNRGRIVQELSSSGQFTGQVEDALAEPCHMSYPFPLQHKGELYVIPETHQLGGVFAWRWDPATRRWGDRREILKGRGLVDPTLVFHQDRWWMFATDKDNGVDSKLHVFYADSPWGPWQAHARNPVKVDVRSSRPGGMPFVEGGRLYRPAQDSSKHYGWRLALNWVTRLTPTEFAEETIRVVDSDRFGAGGLHTLSGAGGRTVIDAQWPRLVIRRVPGVMAHKLRRLAGWEQTGDH